MWSKIWKIFTFDIFFLNLLDRNFERFRTRNFLYPIKYSTNFRDNNYSYRKFFYTFLTWIKSFAENFSDDTPDSTIKIHLLSPYMSKVSKMTNSIDRDEISSQEKKKRSVDKVINRLSRFPPTNRIRKEGKLLRFELLLVLKFNSHSRYLRGKVETTRVFVSLRTDPNMSGVHCCRLLWRLRAPSGCGILVKACRKDKLVWVEAHHSARRRWNSSSHGVSKRFSLEPWLLPPRILSRDWNSWRWWNFSSSF